MSYLLPIWYEKVFLLEPLKIWVNSLSVIGIDWSFTHSFSWALLYYDRRTMDIL